MGQSSSNQETQYIELLKNYSQQYKSDQGIVLKHKRKNETFLLKELTSVDYDEYKKTYQKYNQIKSNVKQNILNLVEVQGRVRVNFCSGTYKIYLIYQYPAITLEDQITARLTQKRFFQQDDMWSILQSCLNGLQDNQSRILLEPRRIFIMNDGIVKIIDSNIVSDGTKYVFTKGLYYSPERFENFNRTQRGNSEEKEIIFSLAMSMLNSGILQNCFDCYSYQKNKFLANVLEQKLTIFRELYSENMTDVIRSMLQLNPNRRSSIREVQDMIDRIEIQQQQVQALNKNQKEIKQIKLASSRKQNNNNNKSKVLCEKNQNSLTLQASIKKESQLKKAKGVFSQFYQTQKQPELSLKNTENNYQYLPNQTVNQTINRTIQLESFRDKQIIQQPSYSKNVPYFHKYNPNTSYTNNTFTSNFNQFYAFEPFRYTNPVTNYQPMTLTSYNPSQNTQNLFTDPKLLDIIRKDITDINTRKTISTTFESQIYPKVDYYQNFVPRESFPTFSQQNININKLSSPVIEKYKQIKQNYTQQKNLEEQQNHYEGDLVNGLKEGKGKFYYDNGAYYQGQFKNDKMDGYGILYYEEGKPAYEGYWKQDTFYGKGKLYNQNPIKFQDEFEFSDFNLLEDFWIYYEGEFEENNKNGFGKLELTNGQMFEGYFKDDVMCGEGRFVNKQGEQIKGEWRNNKLIEVLQY